MLSVSWSWCRTSPRAYPSPGYGNQKWGGSFSSSCVRSTWHTEHGSFPIAIPRNAAPSPAARLPVPTRHLPGASAVPCHPCGLPLAPGLGLGVSHPCWHPLEPPRQATEGEAHTFLRGAIGRRPPRQWRVSAGDGSSGGFCTATPDGLTCACQQTPLASFILFILCPSMYILLFS